MKLFKLWILTDYQLKTIISSYCPPPKASTNDGGAE
jgi:hypothetical protein